MSETQKIDQFASTDIDIEELLRDSARLSIETKQLSQELHESISENRDIVKRIVKISTTEEPTPARDETGSALSLVEELSPGVIRLSQELNVLAVGDNHFSSSNVLETNLMHKQILEMIVKYQIGLVVLLGDIYDTHSRLNIAVQTRGTEFIESIARLVQTVVLVGNHDIANNQCYLPAAHSLVPLKNSKFQLTIVDQPQVIEVRGIKFGFCPFIPIGRFAEALSMIDYRDCQAVFCHQEVRGVKIGRHSSVVDDVWSADQCLLVAGHIHQYQWIGNNIVYIGTPFAQNFGEVEAKYLGLFKFFSDQPWIFKTLSLDIPRRIQFTCTLAELGDYLDMMSGQHSAETKVKVKLSDTRLNLQHYSNHPSVQRLLASYQVVITLDYTDTNDVVLKDQVITTTSFSELLINYLAQIGRTDLISLVPS